MRWQDLARDGSLWWQVAGKSTQFRVHGSHWAMWRCCYLVNWWIYGLILPILSGIMIMWGTRFHRLVFHGMGYFVTGWTSITTYIGVKRRVAGFSSIVILCLGMGREVKIKKSGFRFGFAILFSSWSRDECQNTIVDTRLNLDRASTHG